MALYWLCALTSMLTIYVNYPITTTSVCPLILLLHPELSATVVSTVNGLMFSRVQQRLLVTRSPVLGSNFFPAIEIYSHTLDASVSNGFSRSFYNLSLLYFSLRSKRFVLVSEQKKTGNGIFGFDRARNETRAIFRAVFDSCSSFFALKPHRNDCYAG